VRPSRRQAEGEQLAVSMGAALEGFGAAVSEMMAEVGRALAPMTASLVPAAGVRAVRGDPTGDPPLGGGDA